MDDITSWASWFLALNLKERLALHNAWDKLDLEIARKRLQLWRSQAPMHNDDIWQQRLALDGLTEEDFLKILSMQAKKIGTPPDWLLFISEAVTHYPFRNNTDYAQYQSQKCRNPQLLILFYPLIEYGYDLLTQTVARYNFLDISTIGQSLKLNLLNRLYSIVHHTLMLEFHVAAISGELTIYPQDDEASNLDKYTDYLMLPSTTIRLWQEYPVLIRIVVETITSWLTFNSVFLQRLEKDFRTLQKHFDVGTTLIDFEDGLGDYHPGGTVSKLTFSNQVSLIYKPHSISVDQFYSKLISTCNKILELNLRTCKLIESDDYGWVEYIKDAESMTDKQVEDFFFRQGELASILYAFGATDMHSENLIASGEYPIIIDLETFFSPDLYKLNLKGVSQKSGNILSTGYTPNWMRLQTIEGELFQDSSGLAGDTGADNRNIPYRDGSAVNPYDYLEQILAGFRSGYLSLLKNKNIILKELDGAEKQIIRIIIRFTKDYDSILNASLHPDWLRDALDRLQFLDKLWISTESWSESCSIIPSEIEQIASINIPIFFSHVDDDVIFTQNDEFTNLINRSALVVAQDITKQLSPDDLFRQTWLLKNALIAGQGFYEKELIRSGYELTPTDSIARSGELLQKTQEIAEYLSKLSFHYGQNTIWYNPATLQDQQKLFEMKAASYQLYDGLCGLILFFAYAGNILNNEYYTKLAQRTLLSAQDKVQSERQQHDTHGTRNISGGFVGLGSYIYIYIVSSGLFMEQNCTIRSSA